ncbi:MAG: hypothetical protein DRG78_02605 [Epsilonproteobacteria bacterium]|nr:MAG: hypothetical protein DRG78_02605 [Campylobacterota bacterium]
MRETEIPLDPFFKATIIKTEQQLYTKSIGPVRIDNGNVTYGEKFRTRINTQFGTLYLGDIILFNGTINLIDFIAHLKAFTTNKLEVYERVDEENSKKIPMKYIFTENANYEMMISSKHGGIELSISSSEHVIYLSKVKVEALTMKLNKINNMVDIV